MSVQLLVAVDATAAKTIADMLDGILSEQMGSSAEGGSALIDWAVAGPDLASSIVRIALVEDYKPGKTAFPAWPRSAAPRAGQGRGRAARSAIASAVPTIS